MEPQALLAFDGFDCLGDCYAGVLSLSLGFSDACLTVKLGLCILEGDPRRDPPFSPRHVGVCWGIYAFNVTCHWAEVDLHHLAEDF